MAQPYGDLFAANLRAARARAGIPQSLVAQRMKRLGFTSWSGGKASECEHGTRNVTAAELLGLAVCLDTTIGDLVGANTPPMALITFPESIYELSGVNVRNSAHNFVDGSTTWNEDWLTVIRPANVPSAAATLRGQ